VQEWVDNPTANYGVALYPAGGAGYKEFYSCDYTDDANKRPKLVYTYTTAPVGGPADFKLKIDRKTGKIKAYGTAVAKARISLVGDDNNSYNLTADSSGKWEKSGMVFARGKTRSISMSYQYDIIVTDAKGKKTTKTITVGPTSQKFLIARYSKGARTKRLAKFYYSDGTKATKLKADNEIKTELEMVVGDYVLVLDPKRSMPYTPEESIVTDPDEEYRLREKIRPLYSNGEVVGDSIDAATGNFFAFGADLAFDALGFPIEFTRVLNSTEKEMYRGPLGHNWQFGYDKLLVMYGDGSIEATGGDGGGYFFRPSGSGYTTDPDVTERLVKNSDGTYAVITKYGTVYRFNTDGMLDSVTDRNGNAVTLTYDPEGLLRAVTDAAGRATSLYYDPMGRITLIEDPEERQVDYIYDTWGRLSRVVDPNSGAITYEYDPKDSHRVVKITDPMEYEAVQNTFDDQGRVQTQVDAEEYDVSLAYDGNTTTFTDKNDAVFVYNFDSRYRVTSIDGPDIEVGVPGEAPAAQVQTMRFGDGKRGVTPADPEMVPSTTETVTALNTGAAAASSGGISIFSGLLVQYHYDPKGNRDEVIDAKGHVTYYRYDERNNLTAVLKMIDGRLKGARYEYHDPNNRDYATDIYDALDHQTHMEYDDLGNIRWITNAKDETTYYTYYDNGLVETVTDPAKKQIAYTYHTDGTVESFKDGRDNYTYYYYDKISRLKEVKYPKGSPAYYEYDDNGNLVREYSYINNELVETTNSYNYNNELIGTKDSEENVTIFQYNKRGNLVQEISPLTHITKTEYDGNGNRRKVWDAEENLTKYEYNELGWLKKIIQPSDNNPAGDISDNYYDANGNRIGVYDPQRNPTVYH
ncbi:RHS repeat protein, partial [bacterium]